MLLPLDRIHRLHAALISAGIDGDALLAGIDRRIVAQIQRRPSPSQQLLGTLTELSQLGRALDGTVPLQILLQNALTLAGPRREALEFEDALRALKGSDRGAAEEVMAFAEAFSLGRSKEPAPSSAIRLFISHAPQDARFVDLLERHMAPMIRSGNLAVWHTGILQPSEHMRGRITREIERADLAVVFLSADYLADDWAAFEMERVEARMATGKLRVVPILARPFDFQSSPFSRLAALPRDGRPIVSQRNADEAYVEIVRSVRAIVEDLKKAADETRAQPRWAEVYFSEAVGPALEEPERAPPGTPFSDIFCREGVPTFTYVPPAQVRELRIALRRFGRALVLEGPAQIGKSTLIERLLSTPPRKIDCRLDGAVAEITALTGKPLAGHLIIEDAHRLPPLVLASLARYMRWLADQSSRAGKITLVGINKTGHRLVEGQRDFAGRLDEVRLTRQPDAKIRALIDMGEHAANVRFSHKAEIVDDANGSFRLAQELCFWIAMENDADIDEVGPVDSPPLRLEKSPADVRPRVLRSLETQFDEPLRRFAAMDEESGCPGVCLAFLWLLGEADDLRVPIGLARKEFPTLNAGFDWVHRGALKALLEQDSEVADLLGFEGGELTAQDPQLQYHLRYLDWGNFAHRAQRKVRLESGHLVVGEDVATTAGSAPETSILDRGPTYPWAHPKAQKLFNMLVGAYESPRTIRFRGEVAGVNMGRFVEGEGAEGAWRSLLDQAAKEGKLRKLVEMILGDASVAAYHTYIQECIAAPTAMT